MRLVLAGLATFVVPAAALAFIAGGGPARSDCIAAWQVTTAEVGGRTRVDCQDGDPACDIDGAVDGMCMFGVSVCTGAVEVAGCTPEPVTSIAFDRRTTRFGLATPELPGTEPSCGPAAVIPVLLRDTPRGLRPSRPLLLGFTARTAAGRDRDVVRLRCVPNIGADECPDNPSGGPRELEMVVAASGTDLDNGTSGLSHNFPLPSGSTLRMCLAGCDASMSPSCLQDESATTAVQRPTFGPPLPLFAAGVPTCIVNRFDTPGLTGGTADVATGAVRGDLRLSSEVYLTASTQICPACSAADIGGIGVCRAGRRAGLACRSEAVVQVAGAAGGSGRLTVSSDCPPLGPPAGTLRLTLPLTTATSTLSGPNACGAASDDACRAAACGAVCTGSACVTTTADGTCVDVKGGLSQACCASSTATPCFPTATGDLVRSGSAATPLSAWPDPTYPKSAQATLVSTFCEPRTGSAVLDVVAGLPGPGALVLPVAQTWVR
jgi:hypothetical protein